MAAKADELLGLFQSGLTKLAASFNIVTGAVQSFGNTLGQFVQLFNPAVVNQFTFAVRDLTATIGQALTPILAAAVPAVRMLGDLFDGIRKQIEPLISQGLSLLAPVLGVVGQAVQQLAGQALTVMLPAWNQLIGVFTQFLPVLQPLLGLAVQLAGVLLTFQTSVLNLVLAPLKLLLPVLGLAASVLGEVLSPLIEANQLFMQLGGLMTQLVGALAGELGTLLAEVAGLLVGPLLTGFRYLVGVLRDVMSAVRQFFGLDELKPLEMGDSRGKALAQTGVSDTKSLLTKFQTSAFALGGSDPQQQVVKNTDMAAGMLTEIRRYLSEGLPKDIETLAGRVANGVLDGLGRLVDQAAARINPLGAVDLLTTKFR